jgi:signal transduction histidine kinase
MTRTYAYTTYIWPPIFTILLLIVLAVYTWRRRSVPGALPFTLALLFGALWSAGSALEYAAVDLAVKIAWIKFQAAWQLPSAIAITGFLLEYAWPGRWLNRRNLILLSIPTLVIILLILTDDLHHLFWHSFEFEGTVTPLLGPVGWTGIAFGYSLLIVNFIVFAWLFLHSPQHRWFVVLIMVGQIALRTIFLFDKSRAWKSDLPLDVFGIAFAYLMYTIALFRFNILSPVPLARQMVIDQMSEGMLVVDRQGRVVSVNPSAAATLHLPAGRVCGRLIQEFLPSCIQPLDDGLSEAEVSLGVGAATRTYLLSASPLKDWRGQEAGRLLLLHDVTEQKRAQAQILEQQRALAMLHEREQLARELHDELAQELAMINVQAQLVGGLLEAGQEEQAREQLQVLARASRSAQVDVRREIGKLSHHGDAADGFLGTLRNLTQAFGSSCGIRIDLSLPEELPAISLAPTAEMQLLRIVQESLANIRKHAEAKHVRISVTQKPQSMLLHIQDDGIGFDPHRLPRSHESFGLGIMSQRAAEVGGRVEVKSAPGSGTEVIIEVPARLEAI